MIPNDSIGLALGGWLVANPARDVLARQAPDGPNPDALDDGTVYIEVRDGGAAPTAAELQPYYDAGLAANAPALLASNSRACAYRTRPRTACWSWRPTASSSCSWCRPTGG